MTASARRSLGRTSALAIIVGIALFGWLSGRGAAGHDEAVRALRGDRSA